jgi:hypothetical protein
MSNENKVQELFTKKHYINLITCIIIWISGVTFIYEYSDNPASKIFFYSIIFPIVLILIEWTEKYYKSFLTKDILFLAMLIVTAAAILLYRFDYIGYPSIIGFSILWLLVIYCSRNVKTSLIQLAVFLLSPVLYSVLISFSQIFLLTMLIILSIFISERFLENNKLDWKFFMIAFLFGATLSAGLWVGFIYIIYLLYVFRNNITRGLEFILIMLIAYTLLLFLADKGYTTIAAAQTNCFQMIPVWIILLLLLATLYAGWIVAEFHEVLFASGIILFTIYILSFIFRVIEFNWNKNEIDFSLLIMAVPFLVLSIKEYKVDRFLGKV